MDFCISLKANFDRKTIKMQKCWLHCDTFYFSDMHWISFASIRLFLKAGYIVALYFYAKLTSLQFIFFVKVGFTALQFFFCQSWLPCKTNLFIFVKVGFTAVIKCLLQCRALHFKNEIKLALLNVLFVRKCSECCLQSNFCYFKINFPFLLTSLQQISQKNNIVKSMLEKITISQMETSRPFVLLFFHFESLRVKKI